MSIDIDQLPAEAMIRALKQEYASAMARQDQTETIATLRVQVDMLLEHVARLEQQLALLAPPRLDVQDALVPSREGVAVP